MKKLLCLLLILVMLLGLNACAGSQPETQPTEPFVTNTLIREGDSEYIIIHDGTPAAKEFAGKVSAVLSENFGISLPVELAGEEGTGKEIVVGNANTAAEKVMGKLRGELDFALQVEENALILCAADQVSYQYFAEYLAECPVFAKTETGELTLDSDDNFLYSQSVPVDENYIAYMRRQGKSFNWMDLFAYKEYENADTVLPYRIYVPFNYTPDKKPPLLVNLHGAGLRGNDNVKHLNFLGTMLLKEDQQLSDAIIICPQCPENQKWVDTDWTKGSYSVDNTPESNELKAVVELVEQLKQEYPVDESRIYACGFSMGGYGAWDLLMRHPDLFCAGVPMCGAGDPTKAEELKAMPIWTIHGGQDPTVPVTGTREMAQALQSVSASDFHYTELPNNQHDVWNYTYQNDEIFTWLFSQKKS